MTWRMSSRQSVDVDTMLRRSSRRIWMEGLGQGGRPMNVVSRRILDQMIRQSISEVVERLRAEGALFLAKTEARLATESRRDLDGLLRKIQELGPKASEEEFYFDESEGEKERARTSFEGTPLELGRGLDLGSAQITASARSLKGGEILYTVERNAFLEVRADLPTKTLLRKFGVDCVISGEKAYLLGDPAFEFATMFDKPLRRPLKGLGGSGSEPDGALVARQLLERTLGRPQKPDELCVYSVPADPADGSGKFIYHRGILDHALRSLGYTPRPMIESHVIIQDELRDRDYTGIGITVGAGLLSVCLACKGIPALTFSMPQGGDWIDENAARAIGETTAHVRALKERGMHLYREEDPAERAVGIYYRQLFQDLLETFNRKIEEAGGIPPLSTPMEIVCAGGACLIGGFTEMFREELLKAQFPIPIADVRLARHPLQAVAAGCLRAAQEETQALDEPSLSLAPERPRLGQERTP